MWIPGRDCLGHSEELEARGLARLQKTLRVCVLAWLTASLTGLLPGFMTSKLSHCFSQPAEKQTLSKTVTQMLSRERHTLPSAELASGTRSGDTGGGRAVLIVYFCDPQLSFILPKFQY